MIERGIRRRTSVLALLAFSGAGAGYSGQAIIDSMLAPAAKENRRNTEGDIVVRKDGTFLAAWSDFYGGSRDDSAARISAATSSDGGKTWSQRFTLQPNIGKQNVMSASFLRLRSGDILFFFAVKNSPEDLYMMVRRSSDDGKTWSEPARVVRERGYYGMNNDRAVQLASGRIICPVYFTEKVWTKTEGFRTVSYYSDDDGRTWKRGRTVLECPQRGAMEPGLLELRDGRLLQIIRTQMGMIWHALSNDGGDTWTSPEPWTMAAPEAPSTLVRLPKTGELLLIYNPTVKLGTGHSGPRTPLAAAISKDEGRTWSLPKAIEEDPAATYAYTSVTFHQERALLTYYYAKDGLLSLKFKSIPVDWFRAD
ncbi:MAG: exo-alpha-sialidase [Bryobacteraceae bacterium]|nr:sialidase family protein [Bryobacterales bacterium]NUN01397.1 exo-alpha-sialidase [Bryobacteraceae bacterium]